MIGIAIAVSVIITSTVAGFIAYCIGLDHGIDIVTKVRLNEATARKISRERRAKLEAEFRELLQKKAATAPACSCEGGGCTGPEHENHQCGGPNEACAVPGCTECGTPGPMPTRDEVLAASTAATAREKEKRKDACHNNACPGLVRKIHRCHDLNCKEHHA